MITDESESTKFGEAPYLWKARPCSFIYQLSRAFLKFDYVHCNHHRAQWYKSRSEQHKLARSLGIDRDAAVTLVGCNATQMRGKESTAPPLCEEEVVMLGEIRKLR